MASRWQTYPIRFEGGLITNQTGIDQGLNMPGSCIEMSNVEPTVEGGYARVQGFSKFDEAMVPVAGAHTYVETYNSGTEFILGGVSEYPKVGDTFTLPGEPALGTFTISAVTGSTFYPTVTVSNDGDPMFDVTGESVTWVTKDNIIDGVYALNDGRTVALRGGSLWISEGSGWTELVLDNDSFKLDLVTDVEIYNRITTVGVIDIVRFRNITKAPEIGDKFTLDGGSTVHTVVANYNGSVWSSNEVTVGIYPAAGSLASPKVVAFLTPSLRGTESTPANLKGSNFQFGSSKNFLFTSGSGGRALQLTTGNKISWLNQQQENPVSDVAIYRSSAFYSTRSSLKFSAPSDVVDFSTANGAGEINVGDRITRLWPYKDTLIIFCESRILRLTGSSSADYVVDVISDDVGCEAPDSVQEVSGDIVFLAPDGLRFLSDTDKSGSFGTLLASEAIRKEFATFQDTYRANAQSIILRNKNQYRIFGYIRGGSSALDAYGFTQFANKPHEWFSLAGFNVQRAHSFFNNQEELAVFSNDTGYVYRLNSGNSLDGSDIPWSFKLPYLSLTDPVKRKNIFKVTLFTRQFGFFTASLEITKDFDDPASITPVVRDIVTASGATYGSGVYGTSTYGVETPKIYQNNVSVGGFNFSFKFYGQDQNAPFTLDNFIIEFSEKGRQ